MKDSDRFIITREELRDIQHCCTKKNPQVQDILNREVPEWATHFYSPASFPVPDELKGCYIKGRYEEIPK